MTKGKKCLLLSAVLLAMALCLTPLAEASLFSIYEMPVSNAPAPKAEVKKPAQQATKEKAAEPSEADTSYFGQGDLPAKFVNKILKYHNDFCLKGIKAEITLRTYYTAVYESLAPGAELMPDEDFEAYKILCLKAISDFGKSANAYADVLDEFQNMLAEMQPEQRSRFMAAVEYFCAQPAYAGLWGWVKDSARSAADVATSVVKTGARAYGKVCAHAAEQIGSAIGSKNLENFGSKMLEKEAMIDAVSELSGGKYKTTAYNKKVKDLKTKEAKQGLTEKEKKQMSECIRKAKEITYNLEKAAEINKDLGNVYRGAEVGTKLSATALGIYAGGVNIGQGAGALAEAAGAETLKAWAFSAGTGVTKIFGSILGMVNDARDTYKVINDTDKEMGGMSETTATALDALGTVFSIAGFGFDHGSDSKMKAWAFTDIASKSYVFLSDATKVGNAAVDAWRLFSGSYDQEMFEELRKKTREDMKALAKQVLEEREKKRAAAEARTKAEAEAKKKAEEKARLEAEQKAQAEKLKAEEEAKKKAEEKARLEAEQKARDERLKAEEEAKKKAEEKARLEAEQKARDEKLKAEEEAKKKAEEKARLEAEQKAQDEKLKKKQEEEAKAKAEEERLKKEEEELLLKKKAEEEAKKKAEEEAKKKAEKEKEPASPLGDFDPFGGGGGGSGGG